MMLPRFFSISSLPIGWVIPLAVMLLSCADKVLNAGSEYLDGGTKNDAGLDSQWVVDGQLFTIFGSGFGEKAPVSPLRWDDFENGIEGDEIATPTIGDVWDLNYYGGTAGIAPQYSGTQRRSGSEMSAVNTYKDGQYRSDFGINAEQGRVFNEIYISYHSYIALDGQLARNFNIFHAYLSNPEDSTAVVFAAYPDLGTDNWQLIVGGTSLTTGTFGEDNWQRHELWIALDPTEPTSVQTFVDATLGTQTQLDVFPAEHAIDELRFGHYYAQDRKICTDGSNYGVDCGVCADGSWEQSCYSDECQGTCEFTPLGCTLNNGCNAMVFFDDVYVDITRTRVELGDSSIFTECTHREIQIPIRWSPNEVTIKINQGTFEPGKPLFLFVINENGASNNGGSVHF